MSTTPTSIQTAIQGQTDWRSAASKLIEHIIAEGECFSSGEVARFLRLANPKLMFSVPGVGEYVRDLFYQNTLPAYQMNDGSGTLSPCQPCQATRVTQGLYPTRTPAGVSVFVYGPDQAAILAHDFEVYIPKPGETDEPQPVIPTTPVAATPIPPTAPTPNGKRPVVIAGNGSPLAPSDYLATVNSENRLCVTRAAFEACVHMGGKPMRGGDPIFISFTGAEVNISQEPIGLPDEGLYNLATERGRVLFTAQDPANPFVPGTTYKLRIGPGIIKVDLASGTPPK